MNLRIHGQSAEFGRGVGERVGELLGQALPSGIEGRLGAMNIRLHANGESQISQAIADAIVAAITRGNRSER